jgi:hypothetical protein
MIGDEVLFTAVVLTFATLVTCHVALVAGLARREPRVRALVAFFAPPVAPVYGARAGMRVRSAAWAVSAVAYVALRIAARH